MDFINLKGIVVRTINTGEADKYIDVFTDKLGKVTIYVKGARSNKTRNLVGTQLLNYCDYVLYQKKDKYYISSCELIESFYGLRNDIVLLTYASHFLDIVNSVICENECQVTLLKLLLNTLYILSKGSKNPKLINIIFELRLLKILGYEPYTKGCVDCGQNTEKMFFDFLADGLVCSECKRFGNSGMYLKKPSIEALKFIMNVSKNDIFKFTLDTEYIEELDRMAKIYLKEKLDKSYNKLDFLATLN